MFRSSSLLQPPAGSYSGDRPNPNLRAFVEARLREHPYDPISDDDDVPASVNTNAPRRLMPGGVDSGYTVVVEMGGIEPPSRKLNRRYATGLARCLRSPAATQRARRPLGKPADLFPGLAGGHPRSTRLADAWPPIIERTGGGAPCVSYAARA